MSRSQMEIFGLMIIVIMVAIGLLFAIVVLSKPPGSVVQVKESVMAANFVNTVLSTSAIGCGKRSVRDLLQDCAVSGSNALVCENGMDSCEFAEEIISHALSSTLSRWGKDYEFLIDGPGRVDAIDIVSAPCTGEVEAASRPEKVRGLIDMTVTLRICG